MRLFLLIPFLLWRSSALEAQSVITGTVLGHDGTPMQKSIVVMTVGSANEKAIIVNPDEAGRFRYETTEKGLHFLNFVGAKHLQQKIVLHINKPRVIKLNVRLAPPDYREDLSKAEVLSSNGKSPFNHTRFKMQADGTLTAVFPTSEPFEYLITKATKSGEPVTGTNAGEFSIQHYTHGIFADAFAIVRPVQEKVTIILKPQPPNSIYQPTSPFSNHNSLDAKLTVAFVEINTWKSVTPDEAAMRQVLKRLENEKDVLKRSLLWLRYLHMVYNHIESGGPPNVVDGLTVSRALDELTPGSPFWLLRWTDTADFIQKVSLATGEATRYNEYAERAIETWPVEMKGSGFSFLIKKADAEGNREEADRLYQKLQFLSPQSESGRFEKLKRERQANAKVVTGSKVPPFRAHSLEDTSVVYTHDNIKAKYYLIDFWATWCSPCYKEFPSLHKAYEQFHSKGFEILSFSIDSNKERILRSRKAKFPMPWLHAIDPQLQTIDSEMAKQFEVMAIPAAFLVDQSGVIIATTDALRGEKLIQMLSELLQNQ